jgi:hypothetical protein
LGKGTAQEYIKALGTAPVKVSPLNPGDAVEYLAVCGIVAAR